MIDNSLRYFPQREFIPEVTSGLLDIAQILKRQRTVVAQLAFHVLIGHTWGTHDDTGTHDVNTSSRQNIQVGSSSLALVSL